jgi:hypothetical protein
VSSTAAGVDRERYRLTEAQNEEIFQSFIVPDQLQALPSQAHPVVVFIAGQTGAGKTATTRLIKQVVDGRGGAVNINLDFYKPYHPRYAELMADDDQTAGTYTSADGRTWMAKVEAYAIAHRLDAVMETAMRQPSEFAEPAARFGRVPEGV